MKWRSEKQRMAVMARLRGVGSSVRSGVRAMLGTSTDRRLLAKRLLLGGGVAAGAFAVGAAARRIPGVAGAMFKRRAFSLGLLGVGGTLGTTWQQLKQNAERKHIQLQQKARGFVGKQKALVHGAQGLVRTAPVEAWVARGVDWGFGNAEGMIHRAAAKRLSTIEEVAAQKLGNWQAATTMNLARRARERHASLFEQPRSPAEMASALRWADAVRGQQMTLGQLTRPRKLRTEYMQKKLDMSVQSLIHSLQEKGELQQALFGNIPLKTLLERAELDNLKKEHLDALREQTLYQLRYGKMTGRLR